MNWQNCCEAIRLERIRKRLKQSDIEEKSGVSRATISGWESSDYAPRLDKFLPVLDALGLEIKIVRKKESE